MSNQKRRKAFGLLEVLLAGVIIIIILSALVLIARRSIDNSVYLQQRSQATFLAQEGIEVVRQIRDTNYVDEDSDTKWDTLTGSNSREPIDYNVNYNITSPTSIGRRFRLQPAAAGESINVGGTVYTRYIQFDKPSYPEIAKIGDINFNGAPLTTYPGYKIVATVSWIDKGVNKNVEISEIIANSRQGF